jgi:hypothetical protein
MPQTHLSKQRSAQQKVLSKNTFSSPNDRRRDIKSGRKISFNNLSLKKNSGPQNNLDNLRNINIQGGQDASIEISDHRSEYSDDTFALSDNTLLDNTQDLPIRKPQSAYVIFGKMVSLKQSFIHKL